MTAEIQAAQLGLSFALGLALGLFYDVYRVWFRAAERRWLRSLGDIVWWLAALFLAAWAMYRINGLALRGFPLALAMAGCVVEQVLISPCFFPLIRRLCGGLLAVGRRLFGLLRRLLELVLTPLVWPVELAFRLMVIVKRLSARLLGAVLRLLKWLTAPLWRPFLKLGRRGRDGVVRRLRAAREKKSAASDVDEEEIAADV